MSNVSRNRGWAVNVSVAVKDHALAQADELEAKGKDLMAKARECFLEAAVCRLLHAGAEEPQEGKEPTP